MITTPGKDDINTPLEIIDATEMHKNTINRKKKP